MREMVTRIGRARSAVVQWKWRARSEMEDGQRSPLVLSVENGGDLRRNGGNGSAKMGEC